jgi:hypothetical protein
MYRHTQAVKSHLLECGTIQETDSREDVDTDRIRELICVNACSRNLTSSNHGEAYYNTPHNRQKYGLEEADVKQVFINKKNLLALLGRFYSKCMDSMFGPEQVCTKRKASGELPMVLLTASPQSVS